MSDVCSEPINAVTADIVERTDMAAAWIAGHGDQLVSWRRQLHQYPELGWQEHRTTEWIMQRLAGFGLDPTVLPSGTGVVCDIGDPDAAGTVCLRADIDGLPLVDRKPVPYRSRHEGCCHACGHDAHTAILVGAAAVMAAGPLPERVRLLFQPAEEQTPGGALAALRAGVLDGVGQVFALHCDPRLPAGQIGLREGAITAAADSLTVTISGSGGHTSRPQLTQDVVFALGSVITGVPALLSRRVDPRAGMSLVWGAVEAGTAGNTIPRRGVLRGTVRVLDRAAWHEAEPLVRTLIGQVVAGTGATVDIRYERGVPPVVNAAQSVQLQRHAAVAALGTQAVAATGQSLGGEDFGWLTDSIPGALARLGVAPGDGSAAGSSHDLHQPTFDIDERALGVGVRFTVALAAAALSS